MGETLYESLAGILVGLGAAVTGLLLAFAPLVLASVSPPLAATTTINVGGLMLPQNQVIGAALIVGGSFIFLYYLRRQGE